MEQKVPLVAYRDGKRVVIGEAIVEYDPTNVEGYSVVRSTLYSNEVVEQITGGADFLSLVTPE